MFTELGSKSLAANNYRINEGPETISTAIVANVCMVISENACMLNVMSDNGAPQSLCRLITGLEGLKCDSALTFLCQSISSIYFGTWSVLVEDQIQTVRASIYHTQ